MKNLIKKLSDNLLVLYIVALFFSVAYEISYIVHVSQHNYEPSYIYAKQIVTLLLYVALFSAGIIAVVKNNHILNEIVLGLFTIGSLYNGYLDVSNSIYKIGTDGIVICESILNISEKLIFFVIVLMTVYAYYKKDNRYNKSIQSLGVIYISISLFLSFYCFIFSSKYYFVYEGFLMLFNAASALLILTGINKLIFQNEADVKKVATEKTQDNDDIVY